MKLIREICRDKKDSQNITFQDISDRAKMPISTVKNYFSSLSKSPSVYTVAAICAALGVSLDKYFGISPEESFTSEAEKDLAHKDDIIKMKDDTIKQLRMELDRRRPIIYALLGITALVVVAFLAYLLHFDLTNPNYGLFRE